MMKLVTKRQIAASTKRQEVKVPPNARVIFLEGDRSSRNTIHLWFEAEVPSTYFEDEKTPVTSESFRVVWDNTGFSGDLKYVGTAVVGSNSMAHVYQYNADIFITMEDGDGNEDQRKSQDGPRAEEGAVGGGESES